MSGGEIHYERYVRRRVGGPWVLEDAGEDRQTVLAAAHDALAQKHAVAVRVTKEVRNPETGGYASFQILEAGDLSGPRRIARAIDEALACAAPSDLYSAHARQRIGELMDGWLTRHGATAFELLHSPDLAERLEADGNALQHAIQKVALPEAQARGANIHVMVRAFQGLADAALQRVIRDGRRKVFPALRPANFAIVAGRLCEHPDGAYLLGGAVAADMALARGWKAKVARLLDLAEAAPPVGRPRAMALAVIEAPLGEILGARGGLNDLARADGDAAPLDLGAVLAMLTRLATEREIAVLARHEPGLDAILPLLTGESARLARLLDQDAFDGVRASIARRVLAELNGPRRLHPKDADAEIRLLRALAMALTASAGRLLAADDVRAAFVERSKRLVCEAFVRDVVSGRETVADETRALIRLAENVTGRANRAACARWIGGVLESLRFEREMTEGDEAPGARLRSLAELQRSLAAVGLAEPEGARLLARLGEVGAGVEAANGVLKSVGRSAAPAVVKLQVLLRMAAGETAPLGPAANRARTEALRLLRAPDTRVALAASPDALDAVRTLLPAAGLAA